MDKRKIDRKNKKLNEGINFRRAISQVNQRNNALNRSEDTIKRIEIQGIITKGIKEGKSKETILKDLYNGEYEKYSMYFENWIIDRMKRAKVNREEEER